MNVIQQKIQRSLWEPEMQRIKLDEPTPTNARGELDVEATTALFQRYAPSLFAYLRQHTASREDAEDLLHEVFAIAMERSGFGLLSAKEQERWLWRVTRNKAVDTYRHKTRRPSLALDYVAEQLYAEDEHSPEYAILRREEYARLRTALERLPAVQQEALRLRFVNNLPCAEVAKALGKREGAVRSMLSRAIGRLRTIYTNKKEDGER